MSIRFLRRLTTLSEGKYKTGDCVSIVKRITENDVKNFAGLTGDTNTVHFAEQNPVVHGALLNGFVSAVIGMKLPGPGTLVVAQTLNFPNKCYVNETVTIRVKLTDVRKIMKVEFVCLVEAEDKIVLFGDAKLVFAKQ